MSLLQELKSEYDADLAAGERIPIKVGNSKGKYFVVKGVITANRKNAIAIAMQDGPLAYAAAILINTLRREGDGKYEFMGVSVAQLMRDAPAQVLDDTAFEIQRHVLLSDSDDSDTVKGSQETKELELATKNSPAAAICEQDSD